MVTCPTCSKVFPTETKLKRHQASATCRVIYETQKNRMLQETILKLQEDINSLKIQRDQLKTEKELLHGLATEAIQKPTTNNVSTVNTVVNNNIELSITQEHLADQAQYLTRDHITKGAVGYAEYAVDYPLKDRAVCTDLSRKKVQYKGEDGEIINDPKMKALTKKIFTAIEARNDELSKMYMKELQDKMDQKGVNNGAQISAITSFCEKWEQSRNAVSGQGSTLTKDFVNSVCSNLACKSTKTEIESS